MKRLFNCTSEGFYRVPDGTLVNPFLNPKDSMSGLPWNLLDGLSVAAGQIDPGVLSNIIVHRFVSHVIVLLSGELKIWIKEPDSNEDRTMLEMKLPEASDGKGFPSAAALIPPGAFLQLDNQDGSAPARVLYLSNPSYIFEPSTEPGMDPVYDDATMLGRDWGRLEALNWNPPELSDPAKSFAARERAIQQLSARNQKHC
ncbi:hypothetical protein [Cerasicoccus frondis]|uniref:hypothetical protein n=1 Tax=Cerasicoccus frondis TaxID=490090 RepID=UPI002852D2A3|nr:hypothetical protein [Cerasicoccus frondis]